jgi:transcriptional regulator with XRE-family HTH domain
LTFELNKEKFGEFIAKLRKERGMTQKELAERLLVSDKAVYPSYRLFDKFCYGNIHPDIFWRNKTQIKKEKLFPKGKSFF